MMKNLFLLILLVLSSELSYSSIDDIPEERDRLKNSTFGNAYSFLISPQILAEDIFYNPHWWSHVQEKYNYRENDQPQSISLLAANPNEVDSDKPTPWEDLDFHQLEHYSLSKSGKVIEHFYTDSTVYWYDENDRLRQSVSYNGGDPESIEYLRLYDYDDFGNLLWNAVYFYDDTFYLNHYETFQYLECDSGFYVHQAKHVVIDHETLELESSEEYSFYDQQKTLQRKYVDEMNFLTSYSYQKIDGELFLSKKETQNIYSSKIIRIESTLRDELKRVIHTKTSSFDLYANYEESDSIIYVSRNTKHHYNDAVSGPYKQSLTITDFDDYQNMQRREIYDLTAEDPTSPDIVSTYQNSLLANGTWKTQMNKFEYWDGSIEVKYLYREFLDYPLSSHDSQFQETPELLVLIEQSIPAELRNFQL